MRRITLFLSSLLCVGLTHAAGLWSPSMSTAPAGFTGSFPSHHKPLSFSLLLFSF